jgi:lipopolysaccharide/colanic/teichoic acid biosynthesis glycosyltransferase
MSVQLQFEASGAGTVDVSNEIETYLEHDWLAQNEAQKLNLSIATYATAKRMLDLCLAGVACILLSPVFLLVYLAIRLSDFGPALFIQTRVGKNGREFRCFKFRSMVTDAEHLKQQLLKHNKHEDQRTFKLDIDPRITWIGRILRKTSLDELPQLWNVLLGDMSIVGPRPPVPSEVALYSKHDRKRLSVKPGLTCLWQVSGRSNIPFPQQVELDIEYIEKQSFGYDLYLIFRTIPAVLSGRGAY